MRHSFFLSLILISILVSCSNDSSQDSLNNIFTLQLINTNLEDTLATFEWQDSSYEISLNKSDTQTILVPASESNVGLFKIGKDLNELFVGPSEDLTIHLAKVEDELKKDYSGSLASAKNSALRIQEEVMDQYPYNNPYSFYKMELDSFQLYIDQALDTIDSILIDLTEKQPKWASIVKSHAGYRIASYAINYPIIHPNVAKLDSFNINPDYWEKFAKKFSVLDSLNLHLESKQNLTFKYIQNIDRYYKDSFIKDDSSRLVHFFSLADSIYNHETLKRIYNNKLLEEQITYSGIGTYGSWLKDQITLKVNDEDLKKRLFSKIEDWEKLAKGSPAPDFKGQTTDSTIIALSDLKGKVVYIDVWATWCGPCRQEIPHLEKMYDKYASNQDIALVSVSIDNDYDAWYKMVTSENMGGIQLFTQDAWDSELNSNYLINSIPRFILIDKEGNIITVDAPRPSSGEEIYSMIEAAL